MAKTKTLSFILINHYKKLRFRLCCGLFCNEFEGLKYLTDRIFIFQKNYSVLKIEINLKNVLINMYLYFCKMYLDVFTFNIHPELVKYYIVESLIELL